MDSLDYVLLFLITSLCALSGYATRKLCKMKCSSLKCCGFEMVRDIEAEGRRNNSSGGSERPVVMSL